MLPGDDAGVGKRDEPGAPSAAASSADRAAGATAPPPLQAPAPAPIDARGGTVVLDVGGSSTVPSLLGLSMREAIGTAHKAGFELQVVGSGTAREQQPPPGSYLPPGSKIAVRFAH